MLFSGILFGLIVTVAGTLIMVGLWTELPLVLGAGFVLLALCSIYGLQPSFLRGDDDA